MNILDFLALYRMPVFAPDGEGSGGGEGEGGGAAGGEGEGEGGQSLMDMADGSGSGEGGDGEGEGEGSGLHRPDGLPDHLMGKSDTETLDLIAKAYKGARDTIAKGGDKQEGKVPDTIDGYKFEAVGEDDAIATELNSEDSKPIVDAFRESALAMGMTDTTFQTFMREGMAKVAEAGIPFGVSDDEAIKISAQAEMKELVTMTGGEKEAMVVVNSVNTFGEKLVEAGAITKENMAEYNQMVGTAEGAHIMHRIMTEYLGEKPVPVDGGMDGGAVTQADAYAAHHAALSLPPGAEQDAAVAKAEKMFERAYGTQPASTVRSKVLS